MIRTIVNILHIGDIVGRPGRRIVENCLPNLCKEHQVDFVVANGENAAGGMGITPDVAEELYNQGIDVITTGNHIWDKKEIISYLELDPRIIRPANYPPGTPGRGIVETMVQEIPLAVINLSGRVFMNTLDCPFRKAEELLADYAGQNSIIIVDFHAEATSEKQALARFLDGKVSAVVGTHTHVQTADEQILPKGTAYITDVGMTGPIDSVLGVRIELAVKRFLTQMPARFDVAGGPAQLNAVLLSIDTVSGKTISIQRVNSCEKQM